MLRVLRLTAIGYLSILVSSASAQTLPRTDGLADIPGVAGPNVQLVQTTDPSARVFQLEEQIRQLTGRVEELGFQMLQMQEQMRQMQEDNEFRFQDLERAKSNDQSSLTPKVDRPSETENVQIGELKVDANGNVSSTPVASDGESELYKAGYAKVLSGEYAAAADTFRSYLAQFPNGPDAANANFWLGESLYSQGEFREAARIFLDGHKNYPEAAKAPDNLLKLGMSLVAMDNIETACATYDEVLTRYPSSSKAVKDKVASERSRANC